MTKQESKKYHEKYRLKHRMEINEKRRLYYKNHRIEIINKQKEYSKIHKEHKQEYDKKYRLFQKRKIKKYMDKYYRKHQIEFKKRNRRYYLKNRNKIREYNKQYGKKHKTEINKYKRKYYKKQRKTNLAYRIVGNLRKRGRLALKEKNKIKNTIELIGCSVEQLKQHLESKFTEGMSWETYGFYGWHIDHIKPCANFDLSKLEEQKKCFHYTNLQPLWGSENLSKGDS